jgi:hypothetical protein
MSWAKATPNTRSKKKNAPRVTHRYLIAFFLILPLLSLVIDEKKIPTAQQNITQHYSIISPLTKWY